MKWLLPIAALLAGPLWGEAAAPTVAEKLRARIIETLPPRAPLAKEGKAEAKPEPEQAGEPANPILVLEPMVVTESRGGRELGKLLASEKGRKEDEAFSAAKGGTIYCGERLDLGSWWAPETGWTLLKIKW